MYEAKQQTSRALELNEALLRRNPSNIDVRRSTISAAMAAGELRRANALADETRTLFPDDPQAWMISADVARAPWAKRAGAAGFADRPQPSSEQLRNGSQASANMPLRPTQDVAAAERATWKQYAQYVPPTRRAMPVHRRCRRSRRRTPRRIRGPMLSRGNTASTCRPPT